MRLYYCGGEVASHVKLLEEQGISTIALSYVGLTRRVKFARPWVIAEKFRDATEILLDSGAYSLNKPDSKIDETEATELAVRYMAFASQNLDRVAGVIEFDALILGDDFLAGMREDFYDGLGDKFIPVWHSLSGLGELNRLAEKYSRVGILQDALDDEDYDAALRSLAGGGTRLHGIGMTRMKSLRQLPWDSVSSTSWISPIAYGDVIIFKENKLHRYPRTRRDKALKEHAAFLQDEGFDVPAIEQGGTMEMLRLSAWSWSRYVDWINAADPARDEGNPGGTSRAGEMQTYQPPRKRETVLLPVLGIHAAGSSDGETTEDTLSAAPDGSFLACSSCYIRNECPEYEPGASCKFRIPVLVESANQLRALLNTVIQIQTQRVLTMTMMEQAKGGYADASTGAEIDRLGRLVKLRTEAEKSSFTMTVTATGDAAKTGYISSLLGKDAGDRLTALPEPVSAQQVMNGTVQGQVVP